jgi:PAS domain S-box-containing protein
MINQQATIDELKNKLAQSQESETRLRVLFEAATDGLILFSLEGKMLDCNPAAIEMFGFETKEQFMEQTPVSVTPERQPDGSLSAEAIQVNVQTAFQTGAARFEWLYCRANGDLFWSDVSLAIITWGDEKALYSITRDLTEQKQAEADLSIFRSFADNSALGLAIGTLDGKLTYGNKSLCEMLNIADPADLQGQSLMTLYPESMHSFLNEEVLPAAVGEGQWIGELTMQTTTGQLIPTMQTPFLIRDTNDAPAFLANIITDLTEQKQAQAEREQLQLDLIEVQRQSMREIATPIIPVMDSILVMPLIGSIDSQRAQDIMRTLLAGITEHRAKVVILDITGVPVIDTGVANHLNKTIQAARLKGTKTIITGVSDAVAETIVDLGIDWGEMETLRDLQTGLLTALERLGFSLERKNGNGTRQ